jgi:hypothetical protein
VRWWFWLVLHKEIFYEMNCLCICVYGVYPLWRVVLIWFVHALPNCKFVNNGSWFKFILEFSFIEGPLECRHMASTYTIKFIEFTRTSKPYISVSVQIWSRTIVRLVLVDMAWSYRSLILSKFRGIPCFHTF